MPQENFKALDSDLAAVILRKLGKSKKEHVEQFKTKRGTSFG
jgi:hypothetical protein